MLPLFLPIAVAVIAGEAIAGEAQQGTLRYLLVRPVGRTRLLVAKLVSVMVFVVLTVLVVAVTAYVVGALFLGSESVTTTGTTTSVSGSGLSHAGARRAHRAGPGLRDALHARRRRDRAVPLHRRPTRRWPPRSARWRSSSPRRCCSPSTRRRAPPYLPTRYWLAFVDLFRDPILWRDVVRGVLLQGVYVVVFLGGGLGQLHDQGRHRLADPPPGTAGSRRAQPAITIAITAGVRGMSVATARSGADVLEGEA